MKKLNNSVSAIILNYNDSDTTCSLLQAIKGYEVFDNIIVVDGHSTDDSFFRLQSFETDKIRVVLADKNGGYGYGNNIGLRIVEELNSTYALVINPDVSFSEETIIKCVSFLKIHKECACVAPVSSNGKPMRFAPPLSDACFSNMLLNKIIKPRYYKSSYFKNKSWCYVDALPGSLILFSVEAFSKAGFFDEKVFLYHEEIIIGKRLAQCGFKTAILLDCRYFHYHSVSVRKSFKSAARLKLLTIRSHKYYLNNYCNNSRFAVFFLSVITPICLIESSIWSFLHKK